MNQTKARIDKSNVDNDKMQITDNEQAKVNKEWKMSKQTQQIDWLKDMLLRGQRQIIICISLGGLDDPSPHFPMHTLIP